MLGENNCTEDKVLPLRNENDSDSTYSNFKAANANLFSLNSSSNVIRQKTLSPQLSSNKRGIMGHSGLD